MEHNISVEEQLAHLEKQYKMVVNALFPNFFFVFDENFHFVDVIVPSGLRLFHSREELIGVDARKFYTPEINEIFITNIQECLNTKQWKEIEYHLDINNTRSYFQARIVPIEGNKVMCFIQDIGNRVRRMEELLAQRKRIEEANLHKNAFLANVSHEIRTPLNAIISFSEFLMNEECQETKQSYMEIIRNSNSMVLQIISDILDLSRLESGMSEFHFEEIDIVALLKETVEIYQAEIKDGVRLIVELPNASIQAPTDANRVKQVVFNFLSNAMKYTEQGSITLKVEEEENFLKFSVIDTGCGIPESKLELIFNRFEKIGRRIKGTGLGLAICKSIVEQLGGTIGVSSKEGEGSKFWFTIPYRQCIIDLKKSDSLRENTPTNKKKKILISETNMDNLQFVRNTLSDKFDIVEVTESEKLFSSFILDNPDLILMCIEAAYKNDDLIKKIHAISPNVPIIAITTNDFYHDQRWALENGCNDVIARPFSASKLIESITAYMA